MKIQLKKLRLLNFKGIRELDIEFGHEETNIYGANASGKTSIFDAFTWCLFGKDSDDRADFNVKTLNSKNEPIHKLSHEVEAILDVDGREHSFRRLLQEKWTKKRGSTQEEFTGHTTEYFVRDVPVSEREYKEQVAALIPEDLFKMITNPFAFNSLKWQERRKVLMEMAGEISDSSVIGSLIDASNKPSWKAFSHMLSEAKSLDNLKKVLAAKIKKVKDEKESLPARIDEQKRTRPEEKDWVKIGTDLRYAEKELVAIEAQIGDRIQALQAKQKEREAIQRQIFQHEEKAASIERAIRTQVSEQHRQERSTLEAEQSKLRHLKSSRQAEEMELRATESKIKEIERAMQQLRTKWAEINREELVFDDHAFKCPTCKRLFDDIDLEEKKAEMQANFNQEKAEKLQAINAEGAAQKAIMAQYQNKLISNLEALQNTQKQIAGCEAKIVEIEQSLEGGKSLEYKVEEAIHNDADLPAIRKAILELRDSISTPLEVDDKDLKERKSTLQQQVNAFKQELALKDHIERIDKRIAELESQEETLAQELADLEKQDFMCAEFTKAKMLMVDERINGLFSMVRFKMFDTQINGGETETCECLINGVPFRDANTASQVNAGLDIIRALCVHHNVLAPIFLDGRESITKIIPMENQIVNLIVSPKDKTFRIEILQSEMIAQ